VCDQGVSPWDEVPPGSVLRSEVYRALYVWTERRNVALSQWKGADSGSTGWREGYEDVPLDAVCCFLSEQVTEARGV